MEHEAEPAKNDQEKIGANRVGFHGKAPHADGQTGLSYLILRPLNYPFAEGTRPVVGIILDDLADCDGLTQFLDTDMPYDTLINGVLGELELTTCNFLAVGFKQVVIRVHPGYH
jgi:hypothetical protein